MDDVKEKKERSGGLGILIYPAEGYRGNEQTSPSQEDETSSTSALMKRVWKLYFAGLGWGEQNTEGWKDWRIDRWGCGASRNRRFERADGPSLRPSSINSTKHLRITNHKIIGSEHGEFEEQ